MEGGGSKCQGCEKVKAIKKMCGNNKNKIIGADKGGIMTKEGKKRWVSHNRREEGLQLLGKK